MILAEFNESGSAFRFSKGDEGEHAEWFGNEDIGYLAVFDEVRLEVFLRDIFRHATHENTTAQMWLRCLEEESAQAKSQGRKSERRKSRREQKRHECSEIGTQGIDQFLRAARWKEVLLKDTHKKIGRVTSRTIRRLKL